MITPVHRKRLSDNLAERVQAYIAENKFKTGDRLPATIELARRFQVGYPTLREGLKKLETIGVISVRHGSGIYVGRQGHALFLLNPVLPTEHPTKAVLRDLIETRKVLEVYAVALAAERMTRSQLAALRGILDLRHQSADGDALQENANLDFHVQIALASGNTVLAQLIGVVLSAFRDTQRTLLQMYGSRTMNTQQHEGLFEALRQSNKALAVKRMRLHLESVSDAILQWDPTRDQP